MNVLDYNTISREILISVAAKSLAVLNIPINECSKLARDISAFEGNKYSYTVTKAGCIFFKNYS